MCCINLYIMIHCMCNIHIVGLDTNKWYFTKIVC